MDECFGWQRRGFVQKLVRTADRGATENNDGCLSSQQQGRAKDAGSGSEAVVVGESSHAAVNTNNRACTLYGYVSKASKARSLARQCWSLSICRR